MVLHPEPGGPAGPNGPDRSVARIQAEGHTVDEAALYLCHAVEYPALTAEAERTLVRKIDRIMLPMLLLTATLGAVDKVALGTAVLYGLREDLGMKGQQYAWAGSILPIGAIAGMWPSSYLIHRRGSSLLALRFFMGFLEAIIVPGISLLIAGFYKKDEQPPRNALVFAALSSVINGFLSWAVGHIPSSAPLKIWQYLFLIVGSVSMAWSILAFIFLPDSPMNAFFLTDEEKYHAVRRLAENKTGIVNKQWKWNQALEAVVDPKTWLLFLFNIAINIPNGGLITFGGLIIKHLGFSAVESSLLNMPTGVMSTLSAFVFSAIAARWINRRCLTTMIAAVVPIIGSIVVYTLDTKQVPGQMIGLYLLYTYFGPYVVAQANTAGHTKKNVQYSILYIGYAVGNLIGPQTFRESQAPKYTGGFIAMLGCYCACIVLIGVYWMVARNSGNPSRLIQLEGNLTTLIELDNEARMADGFFDQTDFEQESFRYTT
ncbi:hypothetical protein FQN57_005669 [Myotisia sp. PD_48]|nr:hypothetical protein FQN57_005669 [Myotisia sp. PD_48]